MKPKVHTLTIESEYKLIGIVSHLSTHKISWLFNQELGAKFQQADSLILKGSDKIEHKFSVYKFEDEGNILYTLYSNKQEQLNLIKSIKKVDYILKCEGFSTDSSFLSYIERLKKLKNVIAVFEIDAEQLKNKEKENFS